MKRVVTGILNVIAIILTVIIITKMVGMRMTVMTRISSPDSFGPVFVELWFYSIGANLFTFGLLIFYIVDVVKNKAITSDKRVLWVLLLIFGRLITMIVYWFIHILPDKEEEDEDVIVMGDK